MNTKTFSSDTITYEKFIDVFRQLRTHTVHFEDRLDLIGGDYPTFRSYPKIFNTYNKCVGKKFKSMSCFTNINDKIELHFNFKRSIDGISDILISNTDDLYDILGDEQVLKLYTLIKAMVDARWI